MRKEEKEKKKMLLGKKTDDIAPMFLSEYVTIL